MKLWALLGVRDACNKLHGVVAGENELSWQFGQTLRKRKDHLCQTSHLQQTYGKTL